MLIPTIRLWPKTDEGESVYLKPHGKIEPTPGLVVWLESGPNPGYYQILDHLAVPESTLYSPGHATEDWGGFRELRRGGKYAGLTFFDFHITLCLQEHVVKLIPKRDAIMRVVGEFHLHNPHQKPEPRNL